ncbi:Methyltransferase str2 [Mycena sanguinolenta]|uniref:Methyltransferase str2 n=1 Tax=Mycena sanguinolenta TaxID=230812 RepID=A0A8H7DI80_9AGAR|nr:Methyltransferase str2 [Mycena sanguinolenta]
MASKAKPDYVLGVSESEWDRLDAQSNGIDNFLNNKLCPEDIGKSSKILDIGAGSGAWAIRAAQQYPEADVLAVDMNPLPARPLPSNVHYQQVNVLEPFPFPAGSFDVIHMRLVLCHLPDGLSVLSRIIDLVAPGGWILVDEIDWPENFEGLDNAPGIKGGLLALVRGMESVKGQPHFGKTLQPYLESSSRLCEVHVRQVDVPFNPIPEEPLWGMLCQTMKSTLTRAIGSAPIILPAQKQMQVDFLEEMGRDGIVELQFIADEIAKVPSICTHFTSAASAASFQTFFNAINTPPNTIFVEATVNNAKGVVFGGKSFATTSQKAANGVVSYLTLLKANKATTAADDVNTAMDTAVGAGNGFQAGFQTRFAAAVNSAISTSKTQAPKLAPAPAPGDPFVDETASTIAKCTTRRGVWESVQDFVVRAVTGETVTTAAAACSVPAKTATKPTTQPVTKPAAVPAAKPTLAPAAKPAAAPAAKPAAAPAAKPVTAPVAEKPAAKPVAKPVAKPAAKPVAKPAVKPKKP